MDREFMGRMQELVKQVEQVRERHLFGNASIELTSRLLTLEIAFRKCDSSNIEYVKYFPVAIIACLESYLRMTVAHIIDFGEPYIINAEKLGVSIKFDYSVIRAIHGKTITLGELISHTLPMSRLGHVDSALSKVLGESFLEELKNTSSRWAHEVEMKQLEPMLSDPDEIYKDVERMFELRHIVSHEIASAVDVNLDEVTQCFQSCVLFMRTVDEHVAEILYPGAPLTQTDMNLAAKDDFEKVTSRLEDLCDLVRDALDDARVSEFDRTQEEWQDYSNLWAKFEADEYTGGSIWSMIYSHSAQKLTEQRIDEISAYLEMRGSN